MHCGQGVIEDQIVMVGLCHVRYFFTGRERDEVGTISVPARLRGDECRSYLMDVLQVKT
jgi:hypothetical protein